MVEKGIRGGICNTIHQYAKANNKYIKDYDKNKESSNLRYWDVNNSYGWEMSQKLPVNKFELIEETSPQFNEDFIKNYNEECDDWYFLKLMFNTLKNYMNLILTYHFYQKERKFKKLKNLLLIYMIKWICHSHKKFKTSINPWINFEKKFIEWLN